jgi:hypothetical protein
MYVGSPEVISKKFSTKMLRNRHPSIKSNWRVTTRTGFVAIALVLVPIEVTSLAFAQDEGRQIAGKPGSRDRGEGIPFDPSIYESVPEEASSSSHFVSVPDRWGQFYKGRWYDPYNQNRWKGDLPIFGKPGEEWFIELSATSDTMVEQHKLPLPVGGASTNQPGSVNVFGGGQQSVVAQTVLTSVSLIKGDTTFRPPDYEFRFTPVFQINRVDLEENGATRVDPSKGSWREDSHLGVQEMFADVHLANLSERYDFVSVRAGIQKFSSDFRGFIYSVEEPGVRFFGNYDNNQIQYNLAWFGRVDKDTNTGLNTFSNRHEQVIIGNVYFQDLMALGHTVQLNILHREDSAGDHGYHYNNNGFLIRPASIGNLAPKNISTTYLGVTGDGHIGRLNATTAAYFVTGSESYNAIAQQGTDVCAGMIAQEVSYDIDWIRLRGSFFWASGDRNPTDGRATGFDAVFDNPNFSGGDLSFWQRQGIPFIGGGGVNLVNRNSLLPNLRPGKEEGQSNFINPGVRLYNAGIDLDLTPKLKLVNNLSFLQFDVTDSINFLRHDGSFQTSIGYDISSGILYRPFLNNNVQLRAGVSTLLVDKGFENLFGKDTLYQVFSNVIFQF